MTRLSEIPIGDSITGLFYGGAGKGKTWVMGTAGNRALYCDVENRLATIKSKEFQSKFPFDPLLIQVAEEPLPDGGAKALSKLSKEINRHFEDDLINEWDILIVDGATAMSRFAMNLGLELNGKTGKSKSLDDAKGTKDNRGMIVHGKISAILDGFPYAEVTRQDFGIEMNLINKFIVTCKETCAEYHKHFFMTAHERVEFTVPTKAEPNAQVKSIRPGFTGQTFPDTIPGLFDLVWRMETKGAGEQVTYWARTKGDEQTYGTQTAGASLVSKTCYPGIFSTMVQNPNIQEIIRKIKAAESGK